MNKIILMLSHEHGMKKPEAKLLLKQFIRRINGKESRLRCNPDDFC